MASPRRQLAENQSGDEKDLKSTVRKLELYIVNPNERLEKSIAEQNHAEIDLSRQNLTDPDMAIVIKYAILGKKCRRLNLWGNRFTSESLSTLANVLNGNRTLKELDLAGNYILDDGVKILSELLSLNTCALKEIDLSSNAITDVGANYLSNMFKKNKKLKVVTLDNNLITKDGFKALADALISDNKKLQVLKLQWSAHITRTAVKNVLNLLKDNETLEYLYLRNSSDLKNHADELEDAAFQTGFDVII